MDLSFTYSPWFFLLIVPAAAGLAWWMYRGTKDQLPGSLRWVLGGLRFIALALLGGILLQPLLTANQKLTYLPIIAVLQDDSESLRAQPDSTFVKTEFPGILQQFMGAFDPAAYDVSMYAFGTEVDEQASPDSLTFKQQGTNLSRAIERVTDIYQNQNLGAIVVLSDGLPTEGASPLYQIQNVKQPVYTVLVGDTTPQRDLSIKEVLFNEIAYLNTEIPVRVKVRSSNFDQAPVNVTLRQGSKTLGTQQLSLSRNRPDGEVTFFFKPTETGLQQYIVNISRLDGEITYRNNSRRIFINVLETKVKIALFAGAPHPDLGALRQAFGREQEYEISEYILKSPGTFYQNPGNLSDVDLLILHNFPQSKADEATVEQITELVKEEKKPIIYFVGQFTDLRTLSPLYEYMGITPREFSPKAEEVIADFQPNYRLHSTFTFGDRWLSWANTAPPIYRNRSNWQAKQTAEVYATAKIKNIALDYPVFGLQNLLGRKNMVFLGENIWRMRAHSYVETNDFENFDAWLFNLIKWLRVNDDKRKFRVQPAKKLFTGGEPVVFKGQAYDDSYNPISGVDIKVVLTDPRGNQDELFLNEQTNGQYYRELYNLGEGTYRYVAEGRKDNVRLGEDRGQFSIGESNVEHFRLQADRDLLQQMALRTEGSFLHARELPQLADELKALPGLKPVIDYKLQRTSFNEFLWPLLLVLGLLAVEWVVRKVYSLI